MTYRLQNEAYKYRELKILLLESMPELEDDPECLLDTLEGLSDITEQLAGLIRSALLDESNIKGVADYMKKLGDRKSSLVARARKKRVIALNFMSDLGLKRIDAPDLTATRKRIPASVNVYDDTQLPAEFVRVKKEPDLAAIQIALKKGVDIPGARLGNAGETLQIRI